MEDLRRRVTGNYVSMAFDALGITKAEFERRSGISPVSLRSYLEGDFPTRRDKRRQLCDAFGWSYDSIDRIQQGLPPIMAAATIEVVADAPTPAVPVEPTLEELLARVEALERILGQHARGDQSA